MSLVPIDGKARGALLSARDSLNDFEQDAKTLLPAIEHCGVADISLKSVWLMDNLRQLQKCVAFLVENTTEAHANKLPKGVGRP